MSIIGFCPKCGIEVTASCSDLIGEICGTEHNCPDCKGVGLNKYRDSYGFGERTCSNCYGSGKIKCDGRLVRNRDEDVDSEESEDDDVE